mgnify:CR=1 FL=1
MNTDLVRSRLGGLAFASGIALLLFTLVVKQSLPGIIRPGFGPNQVVVVATGAFLIVLGLLLRRTIRSRILEHATIAFFSYLLVEIVVSLCYVADLIEPQQSIWAFEESGKTIHFDPVRGYFLEPVASRFTRITHGTTEYVGAYKGNNAGFPDRDDFSAQRDPRHAKRFVVFGDSFSAAQYIARNWPDAVEDETREGPAPLQLLNFSVDGGGLANWWSILRRIVEAERYEIDGVIFAVLPGDLDRSFAIADHVGQTRHMFARVPSWNPAAFPTTAAAARPLLQPLPGNIVTHEQFERLLEGRWTPPSNKSFRFYVAWEIASLIDGIRSRRSAPGDGTVFDQEQEALIRDMRQSLDAMRVPVMVVHIPSRPELLEGTTDRRLQAEEEAFVKLLGARFVDGRQAFAGSSADQVRAMWLPYDGHWGQGGSDRFARFMAGVLAQWP